MSEPLRKRLLERGPNGKPSHPYRKACDTDLAATFARIKREQKQAAQDNVRPMVRKGK